MEKTIEDIAREVAGVSRRVGLLAEADRLIAQAGIGLEPIATTETIREQIVLLARLIAVTPPLKTEQLRKAPGRQEVMYQDEVPRPPHLISCGCGGQRCTFVNIYSIEDFEETAVQYFCAKCKKLMQVFGESLPPEK